jgi:amino acid transporter
MLGRKSSGASAAHTDEGSDRTVDMAKERHDRHGDVAAGATASGAPLAHRGHVEARDRFGGINWGAGFFGWLVAIGVAILLTGIVSAIATAVGSNANWTQTDAEREAGTIGLAAAIGLVAILTIAYFVGGYVAGRMSRFDGGKQGLATWIIGLLITLLAIGLGALFGNEYNVLDRIELPNISLTGDQLSWGAGLTGLAAIVLTLLAAMLGGKVGHRYHDKVDRVAHR